MGHVYPLSSLEGLEKVAEKHEGLGLRLARTRQLQRYRKWRASGRGTMLLVYLVFYKSWTEVNVRNQSYVCCSIWITRPIQILKPDVDLFNRSGR